MRHALLAACIVAIASPALAQSTAPIDGYKPPRTSAGHPSFEGVWLSHSISELEALPGTPNLVVPEAEAKKLSDMVVNYHANLAFNFLDPEVPELFREAGRLNGLNTVRGERRTRQLVLPADGKMPFTPRARQQADGLVEYFENSPNPPPALADGPEQRPVWERCVALGGAPPIANPQTWHPIQIYQTRDFFILQEEYHNGPRIIPYTDTHKPTNFRSDLGDAIARWEGDTLVIETINLHLMDRTRVFPTLFLTQRSKVIEKFARVGPKELLYQ
ncbi:MAG TPA: hypothetical protein VFV70_10590, partial [Hyphomonadaceae bacterium]|nr:hypothetical protein [Hyphomonadaceae bacterium]